MQVRQSGQIRRRSKEKDTSIIMRKITRRLAVLTSATALMGFGLTAAGGSVALADGQNGTTLSASVTANGTNDGYYPWTISKTVNPDTLNLFQGDTGTAHFTVTATKGSLQGGPKVCGTVTINNGGSVSTENLAAELDVSNPPN